MSPSWPRVPRDASCPSFRSATVTTWRATADDSGEQRERERDIGGATKRKRERERGGDRKRCKREKKETRIEEERMTERERRSGGRDEETEREREPVVEIYERRDFFARTDRSFNFPAIPGSLSGARRFSNLRRVPLSSSSSLLKYRGAAHSGWMDGGGPSGWNRERQRKRKRDGERTGRDDGEPVAKPLNPTLLPPAASRSSPRPQGGEPDL